MCITICIYMHKKIAICYYHVIFLFMLELLIRVFIYGDVINIIFMQI
jgi:hypothetical protein